MPGRISLVKMLLASAILALSACSGGHHKSEQGTTVFLVRHAEKETTGSDPDLTASGYSRAERLARILQREHVKSIWSTDYRRTVETATPLSKLIRIPVTLYNPADLAALADKIKSNAETALIVGHSNTTPELAELLGGDAGPPIDEAEEYDRLYVLTGVGTDNTETEIRRYGTPYVATGNE